ncbi:MAG: type II toxin-antitoxin system prevent-host-death family antitoxin [Coriobacteriia bacterium]|jgi:prevent-host-death family protein|nr:type II toxin-antitoxin system prevent-host-death family antitoxin [Coriobacteriia bacterium]MDR2715112.1 type II toxin-antitoxin system prevent-host-death family antitoxin [Coriobacteriales bacterium]
MTITMNMQDAKTNLSKLVAASLAGEEVVIANRGTALAKLVPYEQPTKRMLGFVGGAENWDDAFFEPLPEEELAAWGL